MQFATISTLILACSVSAAPIPKDANAEAPADLKAIHELIAKAVKTGKWLDTADEAAARQTVRRLLDRVTATGKLPERKFPVEFKELERFGVADVIKRTEFKKFLVVGGDVTVTSATDSVILASGHVQLTGATNSIVVAKSIQFTVAQHSLMIADDYISGTSARPRQPDKEPDTGCVLVAGDSIRLTRANDTICHVIRPDTRPRQRAGFPDMNPFPIQMTTGTKTLILNSAEHWKTNGNTDCRSIEPKTPIAK